jgi:hypothetical protein
MRDELGRGNQAYHGHGVSFAYPARWQEQRVPSSAQDGKLVWSVVFVSPDPWDLIVVDGLSAGILR